MIPLLAPVLGIDPQSGYQPVHADGRALYERISAAVREYLIACVRDGPALLLVEDMHWFDEDTVELVNSLLSADLGGHLLDRDDRPRSCVVAGRTADVKTFHLNPLTDDEADQLIVALHPEMTVGARTRGASPLRWHPALHRGSRRETQGTTPRRGDDRPACLTRSTRHCSRGCDPAPTRCCVVEAAAVIGGRIDRALLLSVVDSGEELFERVISELTHGRVLEPLDDNSWRFRHELLREVAAELSPPTIRRRLHGRVADALVAATDGNIDWPSVARHYEHAERFAEAASAYRQASADARQAWRTR